MHRPTDPPPRFFRDPLLWLAVVAGGIVATVIGLWMPAADRPADSSMAWIALSMIVVYPVLEELAFRGFIQGWLLGHPWARSERLGITTANLVTTGSFVLLHFLHHPPAWALSVAVPSLVFGFFRDRHGTVYPAIGLHVLYNLFYLVAVTWL